MAKNINKIKKEVIRCAKELGTSDDYSRGLDIIYFIVFLSVGVVCMVSKYYILLSISSIVGILYIYMRKFKCKNINKKQFVQGDICANIEKKMLLQGVMPMWIAIQCIMGLFVLADTNDTGNIFMLKFISFEWLLILMLLWTMVVIYIFSIKKKFDQCGGIFFGFFNYLNKSNGEKNDKFYSAYFITADGMFFFGGLIAITRGVKLITNYVWAKKYNIELTFIYDEKENDWEYVNKENKSNL